MNNPITVTRDGETLTIYSESILATLNAASKPHTLNYRDLYLLGKRERDGVSVLAKLPRKGSRTSSLDLYYARVGGSPFKVGQAALWQHGGTPSEQQESLISAVVRVLKGADEITAYRKAAVAS